MFAATLRQFRYIAAIRRASPPPELEIIYLSGDDYGSPNMATKISTPAIKPIFRR
jgi:hypothetical protein